VKHLLVTNDFPPKHGGIQSYLWELWRRLPPDDVTVLTTPREGDAVFDAAQPFRVERTRERLLLPTRRLRQRVDRLAAEVGADLIVLDPALPLGLAGRRLERPYGLVVHGAEITVPRRVPGAAKLLRDVLRGASLVVAAGTYPAADAERAAGSALPTVVVPPGVDVERFRPLEPSERAAVRASLGIRTDARLVLGLSRLVPRKGFDVLIKAAVVLSPTHPELVVAIGGAGRDRRRLERLADRSGAPVRFLGRVPDDRMPAVYASADVFAMLCRNRWAGLEQEGFGMVFVEAAAAGVPQVAGASGGAVEAVADGRTGFVVESPTDVDAVAGALVRLLDDAGLRQEMGRASRERAVAMFADDLLARRLAQALEGWARERMNK